MSSLIMKEHKHIGKSIIGSWELVSWIFKNEQQEEIRYFGENPKGLLVYLDSGYMSVQIAQEDRAPFDSDAIDAGKTKEMADAFASFLSYYGTYEEREPGVFVHTVVGTLFPNWLGHEEIRYAEIKSNSDTLILSTPPTPTSNGNIEFFITWKKVGT